MSRDRSRSVRGMPKGWCVVAIVALVAVGAGCGGGDDDAAPVGGSATTSTAVPVVVSVLDHARLPVGDGLVAASPTVGQIYACTAHFGGGGASTQGPWFNGDSTWDATKKVAVEGDVQWDAASVEVALDGATRVIEANALPHHGTGVFPIEPDSDAYQYDRNPNAIAAQTIRAELPAVPEIASTSSCVRGEVGIALNGVPIFDGFDAGGRDAVAWEVQDSCHGHPQVSGVYHYHDVSPCLDDTGTAHSALVGYAWDGFGIFGPRGESGEELATAALDECHGHTHTITWDGAELEMYHYHATADFPYTVSCYRGTSAQDPPPDL